MTNKGNLSKGFTMIELTVVIAIVAVVATIITSNVMVYLTKGKNTAIKGNMANLATYGGTYFLDGNNSYAGFCDDPKAEEFLAEIDRINGAEFQNCFSNEDNWCARVGLVTTITASKEKPVFCVDSMGVKKEAQSQNLSCSSTSGYRCK